MAGLFEEINPLKRAARRGAPKPIGRGSLISFHYPQSHALSSNIIHDPYPMVILTDIWPNYIRGLNLHYLTFPYIKKVLLNFGEKNFSYSQVKTDQYMADAFRMYVRRGMLQPKRLDTEWLTEVLASVNSFSPGELEQIRMSVQKQIQNRLQAKANELTSYEEWRANTGNPVGQVAPNSFGNQLPGTQYQPPSSEGEPNISDGNL